MTDWKALCESLVDSFAPNLSDDESAVAFEAAMDAIVDALDEEDGI